ncbi:phosphotransferase enzyme family [Longilinea arvoryzae]|uniref:Phosphotransferase enzyme family n=1 Tax=Longilinea arvoryzae TaxID=360412 RepID=A0A0S7B6M8_9CHLR|nr:phosphotransferase [Longilinea arvoryzae]GAP12831.1 phosphotransferase enzyme family [Longilinea arvoryzae]
MLEKPILPDERIAAMLREAYGLRAASLEFLPLGADANTAVFRVLDDQVVPWFLKLRAGTFDETSVLVPSRLHEHGIRPIIPPSRTTAGQLWAHLDAYTCILYPFIAGRDGFERALSDRQWPEFGAALRAIHAMALPDDLRRRISVENYSSFWRDRVDYQAQVERGAYADPVTTRLAAFMRDQRPEISRLIERADRLGRALQSKSPERVLCHADLHAGNLLLTEDGAFYIVDWDAPILAPKERDLMFIGGGIGHIWNSPREEALFYRGYGAAELDLSALAYYRYERIVEDIAAFCEQILGVQGSRDDRERGLGFFTSCFEPGGVIDIARDTDRLLQR